MLAFEFGKFNIVEIEFVRIEFEVHIAVRTFDRKHGRKHFLQSLFERLFAIFNFICLKKTFIRRSLDRNEIGHVHEIADVFADVAAVDRSGFCEHLVPLCAVGRSFATRRNSPQHERRLVFPC